MILLPEPTASSHQKKNRTKQSDEAHPAEKDLSVAARFCHVLFNASLKQQDRGWDAGPQQKPDPRTLNESR